MGAVFRATDLRAHRSVALKVVLSTQRAVSVQRFVREGQVVATLKHPGIVGVHDALLLEGVPCLVYELVEGAHTLDEAFAALTLAERLELVVELADALAHVHDEGLVHRDVKPENVLVDAAGRARLTDFGIVFGVDLERLTVTGGAVGTPAYMAPEQIAGERSAIGPHTDVWALGVILYEALTGELPFSGDSGFQLFFQALQAPPTPPSEIATERIPPGVQSVCLHALAKAPAERYPNARSFRDALAAALAGRAHGLPAWQRSWVLAGGLLCMAGLALAFAHASGSSSVAPRESPRPVPRGGGNGARELVLPLQPGPKEGDPAVALAEFTRALEADPQDTRALLGRARAYQKLSRDRAAIPDLQALLRIYPSHSEAYYRLAASTWNTPGSSPPELDREVASASGFYFRALARERARDLVGAQADYTQALRLLPKQGLAHNNRGVVRVSLGDLRGGLADLNRALELSPRSSFRLNRSDALLKLDRPLDALHDADAVLTTEPKNLRAILARVAALRESKDFAGGRKALERAQELAPGSIDVLTQLGRLLGAEGDLRGSIAAYERALALDPRNLMALNNLAANHLDLGQYAQAEAPLRKVLAVRPQDTHALSNLAVVLFRRDQVKEALEVAAHAVSTAPEDADPRLALAGMLLTCKRPSAALAELRVVLAAHPQLPRAHYLHALALRQQGAAGPSLQALGRAIALDPASIKLRLERAKLLLKGKRYREARADFDLLIAGSPTAVTYTGRGHARMQLGDSEGALADYELALRLDPDAHGALTNRGALLTAAGRHKQALADFDRLVRIAPERANPWHLRALVRFELGDFPGCAEDCLRYRQLAPQDPAGAILEGRALQALGEHRRALACFDAALTPDPRKPEALERKVEVLTLLKEWAQALKAINVLLEVLDPDTKHARLTRRARTRIEERLR
jgi:tetratricopeptide (TPR) repeat protein